MVKVHNKTTKARGIITSIAMFFSLITAIKLRVLDRVDKIKNTLPIIKVEKAMARTSPGVCPSSMELK